VSGTIGRRAVACAVDAAATFAIIEAGLVLARCEAMRSANGFATILFASMGCCVPLAALPALAVATVSKGPSRARAIGLVFAAAALAMALATSSARAPFMLLALVGARAAVAPAAQARFARNAAGLFAVGFALAALASSHAARSFGASSGLVLASTSRLGTFAPLWRMAASPTLTANARPSRVPDAPWSVERAFVFSLRGISADECASLQSVRVIARNSAVLVDARTDGGDPLRAWRQDSADSRTRFVRCERRAETRFELAARCAFDAVSAEGPLALALAIDARANPGDLRAVDALIGSLLQRANERHPLSRSIVALACGASPTTIARDEWPSPMATRAVVMLSAPGVRPSLARGAVLSEELGLAVSALARGRAETSPLVQLARRERAWFDRAVRVRIGQSPRSLDAVYTARYALHVQSARWYVALFDLDLDPRASVNRADALPTLTRALLATP
jgi:hypothetical protein